MTYKTEHNNRNRNSALQGFGYVPSPVRAYLYIVTQTMYRYFYVLNIKIPILIFIQDKITLVRCILLLLILNLWFISNIDGFHSNLKNRLY